MKVFPKYPEYYDEIYKEYSTKYNEFLKEELGSVCKYRQTDSPCQGLSCTESKTFIPCGLRTFFERGGIDDRFRNYLQEKHSI